MTQRTADREATPLTPRLPAFYFGGDYNPEQWRAHLGYDQDAVWGEDMRLMRLAGVNVATVGVFSWVTHQPDEQTFQFEWLDSVMDMLATHDIAACLATGTAAQPDWLSHTYPSVLPVDENGLRRGHGERMNFCPTSPEFRHFSQALARAIAERYQSHPALLLWHVSNEYGPSCYCDHCAARFRVWLQARYGSLAEVNRRWCTTFWSHTYTSWDYIVPPGRRTDRSIQGLILDYARFMSDMNLECYRGEAAILREITPSIPITTNLMGTFKPLDYFAWAPHLDVVSWDSYPPRGEHPSTTAFRHDLMRGLKDGQPFLLMEQTPSQVQWQPYGPLKRPDIMRLLSYQAIAHGSDAVMYFQWRQSHGSAEKYHGAVVSHAGHEQTRVFSEVARLGGELHDLGSAILGTRVPARVAIMFSWPNWWNVEYLPGLSQSLRYVNEVQRYYRAVWDLHVGIDIISPDHALDGYDLVIAPLLNMVSAEQGASIERYVERGGRFVTTFFSGVVDENDRAWLNGYPGPLRRALGIWVEEFDPLEPPDDALAKNPHHTGILSGERASTGMTNTVVVPPQSWLPAGSHACDLWCDVLHLEGAQALGTFGHDFYAGQPAITEHGFGEGRAYYVATRPSPELITSFIGGLLQQVGLSAPCVAPAGVEVTQRTGNGHTFTFVLNHTSEAVTISLSTPQRNLLDTLPARRSLQVPTHGVAILSDQEAPITA